MNVKLLNRSLLLVAVIGLLALPFAVSGTSESSSINNAWVELPDTTTLNSSSTALEYIIHFTATTSLTGGVDTVTITFPNGTSEMAGEAGSGYAFTLPASISKDYVAIDPDGAATTVAGYTDCYTDPEVSTYRLRLKVPVDIAAGASPYIKLETGANIVSAAQGKTTAGALCYYRLKVETSQDTSAVFTQDFYLGTSAVSGVDHLTGYPSPTTVGSGAEYKFEFTVGASGALAAGSGTISVIFPEGTTVPSSANKNQVQVDADGSGESFSLTSCEVNPTCQPESRSVTLTVPQAVANDANVYVYFRQAFGLVNPTTSASAAKVRVYTSAEPKYALAATGYTITAGSATKLSFASSSGAYSDDASMINMYSGTIYLQLQDQYGNVKAPGSDLTVSLGSSSSTGRFYSAVGSQVSSATIYYGTGDPVGSTAGQVSFLYKDSAAGSHTITASTGGYTSASWTIRIAPAVSHYDISHILVTSYAPTSTSPVAEGDGYHGGDYIQNAIANALPGETVKLGDGIYELDSGITIGKAITLQSVSGASATTLRPTTTIDKALNITATGSATHGVTISGITLERLRSGTVFNYGIYDQSADYITVQNCVFNCIYNRGILLISTNAAFTNGTISNNTFTDGGGSDLTGTDAAIDIRVAGSHAISGFTLSANVITGQKGKGVYLAGQDDSYKVSSVSITGNTITRATSHGIQGYSYTSGVKITSNNITGSYEDGIDIRGTAYTVKKNTITGNLGDGIDVETTSSSHSINYNDLYGNTGYGVNVRYGVTTVDAKYNWWSSASGPAYVATTGASVSVSNPDGTGENITDRVTYYEWLYRPVADVIADNAAYYSRVISLDIGWNTLSTPIILDASGDSVDELVDAAKVVIAYWYDGGDAYADCGFWEQVTAGYTLYPCDAVYLKMSATDSVVLKYNAVDLSTPAKVLYAGWNLVGLANLETKHVDDAVKSVANTATNLPGYSQVVSPSMNASSWTYSSGQTYTNQDMLVGEGYWIYMQNNCTLAGFTITPIQPALD